MQKIKDLLYRLAIYYKNRYEVEKALKLEHSSDMWDVPEPDGTTKDMWDFDYASNQEVEIVKGYEQSK